MKIIMLLPSLLLFACEPLSSFKDDDKPAEASDETADSAQQADEPAMVAGSYLVCSTDTSQKSAGSGETKVDCRIFDPEGNDASFSDEFEVTVTAYDSLDVLIGAMGIEQVSEDAWHWILTLATDKIAGASVKVEFLYVPTGESNIFTVKIDGDLPLPKSDPTITAALIQDMCAKAAPLNMKTKITFPANTGGCTYGVAPNKPKSGMGGPIAARELDTVVVPLSSDMILCDVSLDTPATNLSHTDELFFVMENYVVATELAQVLPNLTKEGELYVWDWNKIIDQPHSLPFDKYCLGGPDKCDFSPRLNLGTFKVALSSANIAPISLNLIGKPSFKFDFIVVGGGDDEDCTRGEDYILDMNINYVKNPISP
ncbi:MAG: hypothetical protein AB7T49_19135 [Oligoflexales bacterium]